MKTTDIPNACIFSVNDENILTDFDEFGNLSDTGSNINLEGWNEEVMVNGHVLPNMLLFVHVVRGTSIKNILIRYLTSIKFESNGIDATIVEVSRSGLLPKLAKAGWSQYMERLKKKEVVK